MSKKIVGATVGTTISPFKLAEKMKPVKSVNGVKPDEKGDVVVPVGGGFFTLSVDDDGNLWAYCETEAVPEFEYDPETGALYVVQEES